jgi:hypothetical protein
MLNKAKYGSIISIVGLAALTVIYYLIFKAYFPNASGNMGLDYSLHLPNLLTGYFYFLQNGLFSTPWFSPSQCGGFPFYPDPNVIYYSLPQFLTFLVSPLAAVKLTFVIFAFIGALSAYFLAKISFRLADSTSFLCAALFLFNGFYTYRVIIGHLTFHPFNLMPLLCLLVTEKFSEIHYKVILGIRIIISSFLLFYMFQSGMIHGIPPVTLSVLVVILTRGLIFGSYREAIFVFMASIILFIILSLGRLSAELALLSHFPRDNYPLPGITNLLLEIKIVFLSLFIEPDRGFSDAVYNSQFKMDLHEWENGVSIIPLLMIISFFFLNHRQVLLSLRKLKAEVFIIIFLLSVPILINFYQEDYNHILKQIPYIKNSSNLFRFYSEFTLPVILFSVLCFENIQSRFKKLGSTVALLAVTFVVYQNVERDRSFYSDVGYWPVRIEEGYQSASSTSSIPAINFIGLRWRVGNGFYAGPDIMTKGVSQGGCYQPLMGYRLENFPRGLLKVGSVFMMDQGHFNMKNPACYIFPDENHCSFAEEFRNEEGQKLKAFTEYKPYAFEVSVAQTLASWISSIAQIAALICLTTLAIVLWRQKASGASPFRA